MDDPTTAKAAAEGAGAPTPRSKLRPRAIAVLVAVILIGGAYGAARLQGRAELDKARASWQSEKDTMSATIETSTKELAALRTRQALWRLDADASEILADLADKNYGLARDVARESSARLARALVDMGSAMRDRMQPLGSLLDDVSRAADSLNVDARAKAQQVRTLVRLAIAAADSPPPAQPDKH